MPAPLSFAIGLPGRPGLLELPLLELAESELLRERRLAVRLVWGENHNGALAALVAGTVPLALLDVPTAARAAEARLDLAAIFQLYADDSTLVFGLRRSGLRSPTDLAGRRVGLESRQGPALWALRAALQSGGMSADAVETADERGDPRPLLEGGQVAALAATSHLAPWFEARGLAVERLPRGGWEVVPGLVLAATRGYLNGHRAAVRALMAGLAQGYSALLDEPARLQLRATAAFGAEPTQRAALAAQVDSLAGALREVRPDRGPGWADPDRYGSAERFLRDLGATEGKVELPQVFINDFLPTT